MYYHLSNFLRNSKAMQYTLGVLTLFLAISYVVLFTYDLSCIYSVIYNNDSNLKFDLKSDYIVEYNIDLDGNGTLTNDMDEVYKVEGVTTAYAHNIEDGYCRYNADSNVLIVKLDDSFWFNFLMSESYFIVVFVMIFLSALFSVAVKSGKFVVLSNKRLLYCTYVFFAILLLDGVATFILL